MEQMHLATRYFSGKSITFAALVGLAFISLGSAAFADSGNATSTTATSTPSVTGTSTLVLAATSTSQIATTSPGTPSLTEATSTAAVAGEALTCTSAYTADLYSTPSGHAAHGATRIGIQSWIDCNDERGQTYEFKLTPDQYSALARPDASMPVEYTSDAARLGPKLSTRTASSTLATLASTIPTKPVTVQSTTPIQIQTSTTTAATTSPTISTSTAPGSTPNPTPASNTASTSNPQ